MVRIRIQLLEYSQAQSEKSTLRYPQETQGDRQHPGLQTYYKMFDDSCREVRDRDNPTGDQGAPTACCGKPRGGWWLAVGFDPVEDLSCNCYGFTNDSCPAPLASQVLVVDPTIGFFKTCPQ